MTGSSKGGFFRANFFSGGLSSGGFFTTGCSTGGFSTTGSLKTTFFWQEKTKKAISITKMLMAFAE